MEQKGSYITQDEIKEGLSLLKGDAVIQFEKPSDQIVETEQGFEVVQSLGWVKFSAAFRKNMLKKLKGAKLAIFICVSLHLNEDGFSFPGIDKIAEETGYNRDTIMESIAEMEEIPGLLSVLRERGRANVYRPAFVARGAENDPDQPVGKIRLVGRPVQKTPTGFQETSREKVDSKKNKNIKEKQKPDFKSLTPAKYRTIPELKLFEDATGWIPGSFVLETVYDFVHAGLTFEQIEGAFKAWTARGYKPSNVEGYLSWARDGIPPANGYATKPKTDETRPHYEPVPERIRTPRPANIPRPKIGA